MAGPTNQVKPFVEGVKSITNAGAIGERIQLDWPLNFYESTNWAHLAVKGSFAVSTNPAFTLYLNGSPLYSTNVPLLSANAITGLRITDAPGSTYGQWISVGSWTHNGTPPLEDSDDLPNNGWWSGGIDDLRVYNRQLSDGEILTLYGEESGGSGADHIGKRRGGKTVMTVRRR